MPLPKSLTHEINPDGSLSGVVETDPDDLGTKVIRYVTSGIILVETDPDDLGTKVIRYVTSGIILVEASAKSIYEWLGRQICELESRKSAKGPLENTTGEQDE